MLRRKLEASCTKAAWRMEIKWRSAGAPLSLRLSMDGQQIGRGCLLPGWGLQVVTRVVLHYLHGTGTVRTANRITSLKYLTLSLNSLEYIYT